MWHSDEPLEEFEETATLDELPELFPRFFVPPLEEKPQNPILEMLKLSATNQSLPPRPLLPTERAGLASSQVESLSEVQPPTPVHVLWSELLTRKTLPKNQILSWDKLRPSHRSSITTPFLSEQDSWSLSNLMLTRCSVLLRLQESGIKQIYVTQYELLSSLKMTVLGASSALHVWDVSSENFRIDGKDETISESLIARFITIGTLLRRLEVFVASLRTKSVREGPTIHAFAHTLSTILIYLRDALTHLPPINGNSSEAIPLTAVWMEYGIYEETLVALSELYGRDQNQSPLEYPPFDTSPIPLLSRIYNHLNAHMERQSPRMIRAIFAFILTNTSREYLQQVARSVGFGGQPLSKHGGDKQKIDQDPYAFDDEEEDQENEDIFDAMEKIDHDFPTFFPSELVEILPAAQKSLILLRIAQPEHALLNSRQATISWLWSTAEIESSWSGLPVTDVTSDILTDPPQSRNYPEVDYPPELTEFRIFDLEPGVTLSLSLKDTAVGTLHNFINAFPDSLPPITPTLSHLTSLVFTHLLHHASTLSSTLLSLFLSSSGNLNFQSHLIILRSYLLLTAESFKSRLAAALFSDAEDYEIDNKAHTLSVRSVTRRINKDSNPGSELWAVGLAPSLLERDIWPPIGADLSFFLRTVIVDSLDQDNAGWRLGFAIRDFPTGPLREKWLKPSSLDFLYMDYKPPHPLGILISPDIISKYQRIFAFILRLMRVQHAVRSLYRMLRSSVKPLFPTLVRGRNIFMHFRYISEAFVDNLSSYVFDTTIRGNFDPFVARISLEGISKRDPDISGFKDIFQLAASHSKILDDILSACLLRSGQRSVGDLLRQALELVLEFSTVVADLHRSRLEEYQVAPLTEELFQKFRGKLTNLTMVLKGLVDKGSSAKSLVNPLPTEERKPTGGAEALYHLLVRLDPTDWWSKSR
ncbi:gamma-tubulin complex, DGRIP91/SPC98 component protein [Cyathus striatus]|nr:gamma-tubulin complex, DGRIP91/SPC98 component protein [Cyathus striatus]